MAGAGAGGEAGGRGGRSLCSGASRHAARPPLLPSASRHLLRAPFSSRRLSSPPEQWSWFCSPHRRFGGPSPPPLPLPPPEAAWPALAGAWRRETRLGKQRGQHAGRTTQGGRGHPEPAGIASEDHWPEAPVELPRSPFPPAHYLRSAIANQSTAMSRARSVASLCRSASAALGRRPSALPPAAALVPAVRRPVDSAHGGGCPRRQNVGVELQIAPPADAACRVPAVCPPGCDRRLGGRRRCRRPMIGAY